MFRQDQRSAATSLSGATFWLSSCVVLLSFELIMVCELYDAINFTFDLIFSFSSITTAAVVCYFQGQLQQYICIIFWFFMIIFTTLVFHNVPETWNRTFEEIAAQFSEEKYVTVEEHRSNEHDDSEDDASQSLLAHTKKL